MHTYDFRLFDLTYYTFGFYGMDKTIIHMDYPIASSNFSIKVRGLRRVLPLYLRPVMQVHVGVAVTNIE